MFQYKNQQVQHSFYIKNFLPQLLHLSDYNSSLPCVGFELDNTSTALRQHCTAGAFPTYLDLRPLESEVVLGVRVCVRVEAKAEEE